MVCMDRSIKVEKLRKARQKQFLPSTTEIEPGRVILTLPLVTISEANCSHAWRTKHKRHKAQKNAIFWAFLTVKHLVKLPCAITYIRYAPKSLDKFENLPMAFKWVNDALCAEITGDFRPGRADECKEIDLKCDQVKSDSLGIKIIIEF
jgi:hypothetical protein